MFSETKYKILSEILSSVVNKEVFLHAERSLNKKNIDSDASKVIRYSQSEDYSVYASEIWEEVVSIVQKLTDPKLSSNESDFLRGRLAGSLNALKISCNARKHIEKEKER